MLVITIISLILFFVLITRPGYQALATLEVNITELFVYTATTIAVLIGMCQVRGKMRLSKKIKQVNPCVEFGTEKDFERFPSHLP